MSTVSADILEAASAVVISTSKNAMSCLRTASRYNDRSRVDCLSPATVQHDTSGAGKMFQPIILDSANPTKQTSHCQLLHRVVLYLVQVVSRMLATC